MNTQHKSQMQVRSIIAHFEFGDPFIWQMRETLTGATSPSTTQKNSLLLDLPIEIQFEIIELLQRDWQASLDVQTHPLKSLRLTCKQLEALCNPVFATFISINPLNRRALELRKELAPKFAKYLKVVECHISGQEGKVELFMELVLTAVLERTVHLRQITLHYASTDTRAHRQLLSAISRLNALEHVRIRELDHQGYSLRYETVQSTFYHRLLNHILDYHSLRLRVLLVSGSAPMHESTFLKLRDTASQLRELSISRCLTIETRSAFADPQRWACAGRLEYLLIKQCAIHSATIARQIGAGVFGPLRKVHIVGCRDMSGDSLESAATVWTIPPLKWVQVDQFNDLEISRLRSIHAKKVYMRMARKRRPLCIGAFKGSTTFPGAAELHVENNWDDKDFEELKRSCAMRGLTKIKRDLNSLH